MLFNEPPESAPGGPTSPGLLPPVATGMSQARLEPGKPGPWCQLFSIAGFEWNQAYINLPGLPKALHGLRLIHLSDMHIKRRWDKGFDQVLSQVARSQADMVVITGDIVDDKKDHRPALPHVKEFINSLRSRLGTYLITGNHDGPHLAAAMRDMDAHIINDARKLVDTGKGLLELIGLDGSKTKFFMPDKTTKMHKEFLDSIPPKEVNHLRLMLCHYPDYIYLTQQIKPDLFLAGHTHGGQICLPGGYAPIRHSRLPSHMCKGIHRVGETWMVVNRGLGFSTGAAMRLFCPAEVLELHLLGSH